MSDKDLSIEFSSFSKSLPYYPPGAIIARRYVVIKSLGRGGAGSVYLCREEKKPDSLIAVKILSAKLSDDPTILARFYREGKISAQIQSPFVVRSFDLVMDDGLFAYTMEYVPGRDLGDLLEETSIPEINLTISILHNIAEGLSEIHKHNVIHRDLKPSNVIVAKDNKSKITDFGIVHLAKELYAKQEESVSAKFESNFIDKGNNSKSDKLTLVGDFIGTIDYISPEYVYKAPIDERSDIYSLGVLGFQMLTGRVPFEGEDLNAKLKARVEKSSPNIKNFRDDLNPLLSNLIMSCLEKSPKNRPQSAAEVSQVLSTLY